jgi:hypothetical protein
MICLWERPAERSSLDCRKRINVFHRVLVYTVSASSYLIVYLKVTCNLQSSRTQIVYTEVSRIDREYIQCNLGNPKPDTQQPRQSPNDNLQDNTGILRIPHDNVSTTAPLHPTCSPNKWEITHMNIREFITSYPRM